MAVIVARLSRGSDVGSETNYVVLRDLRRNQLVDPFSTRSASRWEAAGFRPPEPRIDTESTDIRGRNELFRDPEVVAVTAAMPTRLITPSDSSAENDEGDAWGISAVGAASSHYSGEDVQVAVLDTGIDPGHPAFNGINITYENFTSGGCDDDESGHGTHCCGTIFGRDVDGSRIGIARGVNSVLIGKVLNGAGAGSSEMAFRGLQWAAERGAKIISMSLGFDFPGMVRDRVAQGWPTDLATSAALEAYRGNLRMFDALMAIIRAWEAFGPGCVVVAAAGNESKRQVDPNYQVAASLPSSAEGVLSVGALARTAQGYALAPFSNSFPRLCAPGVSIKSARSGGSLSTMSGTSMACPHVAGVAALWWEANRRAGLPATAPTVIARMLSACRTDTLAQGLDDTDRGVGIVAAP
jgi:subtilisin family serine protease